MSDQSLDQLAALAGIEDGWWDFYGQWRVVPPETKRAFLRAMGIAAETEEQAAQSFKTLDEAPWRRLLQPVAVLQQGGEDWVALTISAKHDKDVLTWELRLESGALLTGQVQVDTQYWIEERWLDGALIKRWRLALPAMPELGHHSLSVVLPDGSRDSMRLIVAPQRAFVPEELGQGRGVWGAAAQIYALRDSHDWGIGTYGSLGRLAERIGALGGQALGVNPLHALFPVQPEKFSPYAPSSRMFLNTTYLDIEAIYEFRACRGAKRMYASPGFQANLARLRGYPMVDYPDLARIQRPVLEELFAWFRAEHLEPMDERGRAFADFVASCGEKGRRFFIFQALQDRFTGMGKPYWRDWPPGLQRPDGPDIAGFAAENAEKVEFYAWLQFVADEQLAAAQACAKQAGMAVGLYRDLGVGIAGDGADAWAEQDRLALGVSVGAPPDPLALKGQDWGLVPFNPLALREAGYEPFVAVLRANMAHAGALRLDHAMLLQRLYWVPPGVDADQGAYVRYPVEDLFRIVALESLRAKCLVIGEDLGTVPEGFRPRMDRMGIFAYRVMVFEKSGPETFKTPQQYDSQALAIFATHDLPSLRGWWAGIDIDQRDKLNLYPRPDMAFEERAARAADRVALVAALRAEGLSTDDFPSSGELTDEQAQDLAEAAHIFLARSNARLMMVQLEDVQGLNLQMNLPGTVDQHPNWRRRFAVDLEQIADHPRLVRMAERLGARRETP